MSENFRNIPVRRNRKKKISELTLAELETIVDHLSVSPSVKNLRNSALLQITFFGNLSFQEVTDLTTSSIAREEDGIEIRLEAIYKEPTIRTIANAYDHSNLKPVNALEQWLSAANIQDGPLFRPIRQNGLIGTTPLFAGSIFNILKECRCR